MRFRSFLRMMEEDSAAEVQHPAPGVLVIERGGAKVQITHSNGTFSDAIELPVPGRTISHHGVLYTLKEVKGVLGVY